ncbi:BF3164 family lipoprotein [Algoriphagus sp. CAU 1675]|uniref:BF3164 family lipoprotein n=1 Tax=Algoriphagus sp. CAU 1675 TaxID=3032597 RepID=UPI0023DC145A|nr:BF3164 family lipoprotein [Algoriphagus sp. CAU 1675]MDF2156444.1 BF3164 family lipoprotein [Algoriphagus sp. CAU 1675]
MKIKLLLPFLQIPLILAFGCSEKKLEKEITQLESKKVYFKELINPEKVRYKKGKLVVSESPRVSPELPLIHVIDADNMIYMFSQGKNGFGPGEISDATGFDFGSNDSTFWVYSAIEKRISEFSLFEQSELAMHQIKQPVNFFKAYSCLYLTDSTFLGMFVDSPYRLIEFGLNDDFEKGYGSQENFTERTDLDNFNLSQINDGWFNSNSDKTVFAIASIYYDKIDLFDARTKEFKTIYGPDPEVFDFELHYDESGPSVIWSRDIPYQYRDIEITKDRIYALFGGISGPEIKKTSEIARTLRVYDFDGNLLEHYLLDRSLRSIALDIENKKIYGITTDSDPGIAVFTIP